MFAYNSPMTPAAGRLAHALGVANGDPIEALNILLDQIGACQVLRDYGMRESYLDMTASRCRTSMLILERSSKNRWENCSDGLGLGSRRSGEGGFMMPDPHVG